MLPAATAPGKGIAKTVWSYPGNSTIDWTLTSGFRYAGTGERTVIVDDVLQADAGTRTTATTGGFCSPERCYRKLVRQGALERSPSATNCCGFGGIIQAQPFWI